MFTGIIKAVAPVKNAEKHGQGLFLYVAKPKSWKIKLGDSIAVDGACLTVIKVDNSYELSTGGWIKFELAPETLSKTTFGIKVPKVVNLESALVFGEKLDGHLVTGHVDVVGKIIKQVMSGESTRVIEIQFPKQFRNLIAPKGSVTVDGVSLTVVDAKRESFTVSLVSYTIKHTTFEKKMVGDLVNLEFDILAKYVEAQNE